MNERAESVVWEALRRLVRERLARKPGGHLVESRLPVIELRLGLPLAAEESDPRQFCEELVETIDRQLDDAVQQAAAFRPGRTYCHRCARVDCEHSSPPSCRHVFTGYAPTGLPRWEDFAQFLLDRRHPSVDRLYDDPPALVTVIQQKDELCVALLGAFQDGSHELLGQVAAGFFTVRVRAEEGRGVLALTVQVAASHARSGQLRLGLNLLGLAPCGEGLERLWERHEELPWRRAVRWAQSALQTVGPRRVGRGSPPSAAEMERRVQGILVGLGRRLEQGYRARSRRTRHAEERHATGERPTHKAVDDALAAGRESLLVDEKAGTLVVLGARGRTHFFSAGGRHVSSVRYDRDAIERKVRLEQWRPASNEQLEEFRKAVAGESLVRNRLPSSRNR